MTLTTVESINTMLEPRMVAARTPFRLSMMRFRGFDKLTQENKAAAPKVGPILEIADCSPTDDGWKDLPQGHCGVQSRRKYEDRQESFFRPMVLIHIAARRLPVGDTAGYQPALQCIFISARSLGSGCRAGCCGRGWRHRSRGNCRWS